MELAFESKRLRTICENEPQAKLELGEAIAIILKHRLADLRAAATVKELTAGRPRTLDGAVSQEMVLDLRDGYRVVFAANHAENPVTEAGDPDWEQITRVKILRIEGDDGGQPSISS